MLPDLVPGLALEGWAPSVQGGRLKMGPAKAALKTGTVGIGDARGQLSSLADSAGVLTSNGAGAVSWKPFAPKIIVTDPIYGAIGNGVADDSAAILAAQDAAVIAKTAVYFPAGTYRITQRIPMKADWTGEGRGNVEIRAAASMSGGPSMLNPLGGFGTAWRTYRDIWFNADGVLPIIAGVDTGPNGAVLARFHGCWFTGLQTGYAVDTSGNVAVGWLFESCWFQGPKLIRFGVGEDDNLFINCRFGQLSTATTLPIRILGINTRFFSCYFEINNVTLGAGRNCFIAYGSNETVFDACFFEYGGLNLNEVFTSDGPPSKLTLRECHFNLSTSTALTAIVFKALDATSEGQIHAFQFFGLTKFDAVAYKLFHLQAESAAATTTVSIDIQGCDAWTVTTDIVKSGSSGRSIDSLVRYRALNKQANYLSRGIYGIGETLYCNGAYPSFWFNSSTASTYSCLFQYDNDTLRVARTDPNFGAYLASPITLSARAPSGCLNLEHDGTLSVGAPAPLTLTAGGHVQITPTAAGIVAADERVISTIRISDSPNVERIRWRQRRHTAGGGWTTQEMRLESVIDANIKHWLSFRGNSLGGSDFVFGHGLYDVLTLRDSGQLEMIGDLLAGNQIRPNPGINSLSIATNGVLYPVVVASARGAYQVLISSGATIGVQLFWDGVSAPVTVAGTMIGTVTVGVTGAGPYTLYVSKSGGAGFTITWTTIAAQ